MESQEWKRTSDEQIMKWRIWDIIDLEFLLHRDAAAAPEEQARFHARDRTIFLNAAGPATGPESAADRRSLLKAWLNHGRASAQTAAAVLPGETAAGIYALLRIAFPVAGLLIGGAAALSFLSYTGDRPVNVFAYLTLFVASQLLFLLFLLGLSLYRLARRSRLADSPLYSLIARTILRLILSARHRVGEKLGAAQRLAAQAAMGTIISKGRAYGPLMTLPIVLLTQLFGVGLNLGLLGATLFKVATADIAFGWQSTLRLSPAAVHTLAEKIALPWSWAVGGEAALPTLTQVEGSRIILKEGIAHLATPDLASWWPFLCLAVLIYGLLPRLLLFLGVALSLRRRLDALDFRQGSHEQLLLRMSTPLVSTRGQRVDEPAAAAPDQAAPRPARERENASAPARRLLVLIPDELFTATSREEIEAAANRSGRYRIAEILRTGLDYDADRDLLAALPNRAAIAETDLLLIQEAWQPPILEQLDFLRELRRAVGPAACIRIGLIGKPKPDTIFTPAADEQRRVWLQKTAGLGDPCLLCEGLVHHAS
ncbi:MAG: DUF2868 domain-containing protein [Desulfobulbus sp.]|nr:MAG: DUF2868 domain-containing protein [Desulfobulbus sp.]